MQPPSRPAPPRFFLGLVLGFVGAVLLGEGFTRLSAPDELQPFLGDASSLSGVYRPDPELGADYRSLADFRSEYADRLKELEQPPDQSPRLWAWFGNSFVQAPGMLGDTAQETLPGVKMFYLRRNADLPRHVAQIRLLLESGLQPERIVLVLLPIDTTPIGKQPLRTVMVNRRGAMTYRLRPPPPVDAIVCGSRLAMLAWVRSGRHAGNPAFRAKDVTEFVAPELQNDLSTILHVLGETARKHDASVTVLLLPNREQVFGTAGYAVQDFVRERCRAEGLDAFDARALFANEADKRSLFLPDWHFTDKANRMILQALFEHWNDGAENTDRP